MRKIIFSIISVGVLAFLWWTISPLFINNEVQDELDPAIAALLEEGNLTPPPPAPTDIPGPFTSELVDDTAQVTESAPANETSAPAPDAAPGPIVRGPFTIEDTPGHPASGQIRVIETPEQSLVRFEDYNGTI